MANPSAVYKQRDQLPYFDCTLSDVNGARNLTGETVRFVLKSQAGTGIVDETSTGANVVVLDSTAGRVRYKWQADDLAEAGNYNAEWETTNASSEKLSYPNDSHIEIVVKPELST